MVGNLKVSSEYAESINEQLRKLGNNQSDLVLFSDYLFADLSDEESKSYAPTTLLSILQESYKYAQNRPSNAHKVQVYDIKSENAGKSGDQDRTVIEIVNDDMPFLVDSIMGELTEQQLTTHMLLHPILHVVRGNQGKLVSILDNSENHYSLPENRPEGYIRESYIHIHIEYISDQRKKDLITVISKILEAVRIAVADWKTMLLKVSEAAQVYTKFPPPVEVIKLSESVSFLKWLTNNHFTFLGTREYQLIGGMENGFLKAVEGASLGVLRDQDMQELRHSGNNRRLTEQMRHFLMSEEPLMVTKASIKSMIHRRVYYDYVAIKIFNATGEVTGTLVLIGLFTSIAYTRPPKDIPFIRHKVETVVERYGQSRSSHSSKALQNILDTFPRDELFQIRTEQLYQTAVGIAALDFSPRPRVFIRIEDFKRYASVLVFAPRDCYSTETRIAVGEYLANALNGKVSAFFPFFLEGSMVRIQFIIGLAGEEPPEFDQEDMEQHIANILKSWRDDLKQELAQQFLPSKAGNLLYKYGSAFPAGYEELTTAARSIQDIMRVEQLSEENPISIKFYQREDTPQSVVNASIYHLGTSIPLSKRVPVLENLGFSVIDERTFKISPKVDNNPGLVVNLHDMELLLKGDRALDIENSRERLEKGFIAVWQGKAENDVYNNLLSTLDNSWREIAVIRAFGAYLRQLGVPFTRKYIGQTLVIHSAITKKLLELFDLRFNPTLELNTEDRNNAQEELVSQIEEALVEIPSLDEDRIFRLFLNLITSALRTNFYQEQTSKHCKDAICFKFNSKNIENLPRPKPFAEIFVYSPSTEGIHLRGGKIARGGLRWSDRREDFRIEVHGLAKAQQVKNTVIVTTGAKGGFVAKQLSPEASREERMREGIACYQTFVSSLLSITDNLKGSEVLHPENVIRHDEDDPYLVVAADKGTATFSDIANEISVTRQFWLGDAFASGGSAGYDHKKMGITARGAWESVKRHFREMDCDIQTEPFTVIGVGDMSGDVFGNGMLLSKTTKLVAAFDHRDIFIDPNPTQERSWLERKRLFEMDRSSWQNYNRELISQGGGIFSRQSKSIELSPEIKQITGLKQDQATPNELIHALLKAEIDLLWFGGIGTYVSAQNERDEDVGDRANDTIRICASELNAKVVGEGANLGMTQKARIEFAKKGGRLNSDAIDNSAGVNSSDLEVNIKIALGESIRSGRMSQEERDKLLTQMTEEVAEACLKNNYQQSLTISLGQKRGLKDVSYQKRLMLSLEKSGLLNRKLEYLPTDSEITIRTRNGIPLTRPELAVLLAYAKIDLFNKLIESSVPDDNFLEAELYAYFPKTLVGKVSEDIKNHILRREIIATRLSNAIINRGGSTMMVRLQELTGCPVEKIAYAFVAACAVFELESVYKEIDALDNQIPGDLQLNLYAKIQDLLRSQTIWFLNNVDLTTGLSEIIETYKNGLQKLDQSIEEILNKTQIEALTEERRTLENKGISRDLSAYIAGLRFLSNGPDMILASQISQYDIKLAATAFNQVDLLFNLQELRISAASLEYGDYFDRIVIANALRDISSCQRSISHQILEANNGESSNPAKWIEQKQQQVERAQKLIADINRSDEITIAKLTVSVSHLGQLCG